MSDLGTFGGGGIDLHPVSSGGGGTGIDTAAQAGRERLAIGPEDSPAVSAQLNLPSANYGSNLIKGGGMESWSAGTSAAPNGWTLTGAGATIAKNTTNVQEGVASVNLTAALNTATDLGQSLTISNTQNTRLRGRIVTGTCWVKASTAGRVFLKLDDGVTTINSVNHTGSGAFELLSVSKLIDAAATKLEMSLEIASGASITATFDAAMLVEGSAPLGFSRHPNDEHLHISNYQDTTPTNHTDRGLWRFEVGDVLTTGDTGTTGVTQTVTLETAYRTVLAIWISVGGGTGTTNSDQGKTGGKRCIWNTDTKATTGFRVQANTADAAVFADTGTGQASWIALGED